MICSQTERRSGLETKVPGMALWVTSVAAFGQCFHPITTARSDRGRLIPRPPTQVRLRVSCQSPAIANPRPNNSSRLSSPKPNIDARSSLRVVHIPWADGGSLPRAIGRSGWFARSVQRSGVLMVSMGHSDIRPDHFGSGIRQVRVRTRSSWILGRHVGARSDGLDCFGR